MTNEKINPHGLLIMAANSLGLASDIPFRALESVKTADLIVFEEDRPARQVLKSAGIHRDYLKYNEQNQKETLKIVEDTLKSGKIVVYMSDQGCPTLEDPGFEIVRTARLVKAKILVIPGPSALTAALSASPFSNKIFEFLGFPPREDEPRKAFFKQMIGKNKLQIMMDTPYRLKQNLETALKILGESTKGFIALDISGEDENYLFGTFSELIQEVDKIGKKLNFVLIINPAKINDKKLPAKNTKRV